MHGDPRAHRARPQRERLRRQAERRGRQGHRRPGVHGRAPAHRPAHRRPRAARGRARPREDADRAHAAPTRSTRRFARIQFTPDLLPADVIGTHDLQPAERASSPSKQGPDLREPRARRRDQPRAGQGADARCSRRCRSGRSRSATRRTRCPSRSSCMATQNPIEQEGTYPLPEAQVDRFMLHGARSATRRATRSGRSCDRMTAADADRRRARSSTPSRSLDARKRRRRRSTSTTKVKDYIVDVVHATREPAKHGLKELAPLIEYGARPRAIDRARTWRRARTRSCATAATSRPRT